MYPSADWQESKDRRRYKTILLYNEKLENSATDSKFYFDDYDDSCSLTPDDFVKIIWVDVVSGEYELEKL